MGLRSKLISTLSIVAVSAFVLLSMDCPYAFAQGEGGKAAAAKMAADLNII